MFQAMPRIPNSASKGIARSLFAVPLLSMLAPLAMAQYPGRIKPDEQKKPDEPKPEDKPEEKQLDQKIRKVEKDMLEAARNLEFERAASLRDELKTLRGRLLLRGDQPQQGEVILLELADEVGHNPRLDAWASGMLRVDRALADAQQLNRPELAKQLRERTKGLTPES